MEKASWGINDSQVSAKEFDALAWENETLGNGSNLTCQNINDRLPDDWTTFSAVQAIFSVLYSLIFIIGLFGNSVVVAAVFKFRILRTVRNMFIIGLSVSDFLSLFFAVSTTPIVAIQKNWYLGTFMCHFITLIQGMCLCFSTFTLVSIAIDRYILIVHPTRRPISQQLALRVLAANAALAAIFAAPVSINHTVLDFKAQGICGEFCMEEWPKGFDRIKRGYSLSYAAFAYVFPLIVIAFSYTQIIIILTERAYRKAQSTRIFDKSESSALLKMAAKKATAVTRESIHINRQRRTNRMLMSMVIIFGLCWLPYMLVNLLLDFFPDFPVLGEQGNFFSLLVHCIAVSTTMWNPIIYAFLNEQFREAFKRVLGICFKKKDGRTVFRHRSLLLRRDSSSTIKFSEFFGAQTSRMVSSMVGSEGGVPVSRVSSLGLRTSLRGSTTARHNRHVNFNFNETKL